MHIQRKPASRWALRALTIGTLTVTSIVTLTVASTAIAIPLAADRLTTTPDQENVVTYHGVHGFQLDSPGASVSGARRVLVSRKRVGERSATLIDYGNGVELSGINSSVSVTPRRRTGAEQNRYGHNYRTKSLAGSDSVVQEFNQLLSKRLRAASGGPGNARWSTDFELSELVTDLQTDAKLRINLERKFVSHKGRDFVLIGYEVPAFGYQDAAANSVVHWASGFVVTDPEYSIIYYYGAKNAGTRNPATPDAAPLSARIFSFATNNKGERLLDLSEFTAANEFIDRALVGATEYLEVSREAKSTTLYDTGFFGLARMIDLVASAVGENSGNQTTEHTDGVWDQAENVGNISTKAAQGNNALSVFRGITNLGGSYYTKEQLKQFDNIYKKVYDGESVSGYKNLWADTKSSGSQYVEGLFEYMHDKRLAGTEVFEWFEDAKNGVVKVDGVGGHLARFFGESPREVLDALGRLGIQGAEGVAKIAGPIAWMASSYTIVQGFVPQDAAAPNPELIGSASDTYRWQFFDRVFLDVGAGLALDLATGDLIGFTLDSGAVVVKSFADTAEAWSYYRNTVDDIELTEATFFEIAGSDYKRSKPVVDENLPQLLHAERNRTGQTYHWLVAEGAGATTKSDWQDLKNRDEVLFDWDVITATGSISEVAANKLTENNFRRALLNWLEKRNPDVEIEAPTETLTNVLPPVDPPQEQPDPTDTPVAVATPEPDEGDPIKTGEVTAGTAPRRVTDEAIKTGEVTSGSVNRNDQDTSIPTPEPVKEWYDARDGWHNEYRYDKEGNWIGYRAVYPLAKPREPTEGDGYKNLFDDVADAAEAAAAEEAELAARLEDPYSEESIEKRRREAQAEQDAKYEASRKAAGLPPLDTFESAEEREAYYQGQLNAQYLADRKARGLPDIDNFDTSAERKAHYEGIQNAELEADRKAKGLPPLDKFKTAAERDAYYSGLLQAQYDKRRKDQGLPILDEFDNAQQREAYFQGKLDEEYEKDRSDAGLPPLDEFATAEERKAYYQARMDAKQAEAAAELPPLDNYKTPEEREAANRAWLAEFQKRKQEAEEKAEAEKEAALAKNETATDKEEGEGEGEGEAKAKNKGLTITPLPGGKYPNTVDYGDGTYPNQQPIDWSKFNVITGYPNQIDYGDETYPNPVTIDWSKWDSQAKYPNQLPTNWFQTPYDGDSFSKFTRNNAFKYGNMFGMIPTNLPAYDEFIAYYGLEHLNRLARNAGYPSIFAALNDQDYLIGLSKNPGFRTRAMNFECNIRFGVNYDCIALNRQERGQLELGELLQESSAFASDGFSDVSISGLLLSIFLRDFGLEDGDVVNLMVSQFGQTLLDRDISLTNAGTRESTRVRRGVVEVTVTALNTGDIPPNTASVVIEDVSRGEAAQEFGQDTGGSSSLKVEVGGG